MHTNQYERDHLSHPTAASFNFPVTAYLLLYFLLCFTVLQIIYLYFILASLYRFAFYFSSFKFIMKQLFFSPCSKLRTKLILKMRENRKIPCIILRIISLSCLKVFLTETKKEKKKAKKKNIFKFIICVMYTTDIDICIYAI